MIELQWVKRKKVYVDGDGEFPFTENVLQSRYGVMSNGELIWTIWTDVLVVDETVNQDD